MNELRRRLGRAEAVIVGIGSMVGAGVFAVWAPAASAAGAWLLLGLVLAGAVALCNATSSAQLAAVHPESGGTYVYARERLSPFWGHVAGWGFVVGKTASCAAMAMTAGAYLWPDQSRSVATAAVLVILVVNLGGLERTVAVTKLILIVAGLSLMAVVIAGLAGGEPSQVVLSSTVDADLLGVIRSAGILFFAFAGYARIATLGEEVIDPARTIPWAIPRALTLVLVLYLVVAATTLRAIPAGALAASEAPLRLVIGSGRFADIGWIVDIGAAVACLGVLLNLIPGVSRTVLAMARRSELPHRLAAVDGRRHLPIRAEVTVTSTVLILVNLLSITSAIAVSGVAVLTYYGITNAAALRLAPEQRIWSPWLARFGLAGCVILVAALPVTALVGGLLVITLGVIARSATMRAAKA